MVEIDENHTNQCCPSCSYYLQKGPSWKAKNCTNPQCSLQYNCTTKMKVHKGNNLVTTQRNTQIKKFMDAIHGDAATGYNKITVLRTGCRPQAYANPGIT